MPCLPDNIRTHPRYMFLRKATIGSFALLAGYACEHENPVVPESALGRLGITPRRRDELLNVGLVDEHPAGLEISATWNEIYALTRVRKAEREKSRRYRERREAQRKRRAQEAEILIDAAIAGNAYRNDAHKTYRNSRARDAEPNGPYGARGPA